MIEKIKITESEIKTYLKGDIMQIEGLTNGKIYTFCSKHSILKRIWFNIRKLRWDFFNINLPLQDGQYIITDVVEDSFTLITKEKS